MPAATATLFLATPGFGITRAERSGGRWRVQRVLAESAVRCLAVGGDTQWAGSTGEGVWRSDDGGRSWRPAGLGRQTVTALAASPDVPDVVYAGLKPAALAVTRDGGERWMELDGFRRVRGRWFWFSPAERPWSAYLQGLAVAPGDPDHVVAGIEFGAVVRSTDGGATWSGHRKGAIRDGGETWTAPGGNQHGYGWACAADPGDPDTFYCSAAPGPGRAHGSGPADAHIYRSTAGGPWVRLAGGLPDPLEAMPYALLTDRSTPGHLYAGLGDGRVFFTGDRGDHWDPLELELGRVERAMILAA